MAKKAAHGLDVTLNSVAFEGYLTDWGLDLEQETPDVTCLGDAGPRVVVGNYNWKESIAGPVDVADGASDASIFALLASAGVQMDAELTGTDGSANNPEYQGTVVLRSYKLSGKVGGALTYSAELQGSSALTRDAS